MRIRLIYNKNPFNNKQTNVKKQKEQKTLTHIFLKAYTLEQHNIFALLRDQRKR